MISPRSSFGFLDRGRAETLMLVPGWATDYRIFGPLEPDYNFIVCVSVNDADFNREAARFLDERGIRRVEVVGWSMGGYIASSFAARHPQRVSGLWLCGMRERYDMAALTQVRSKLEKNGRAFLTGFYRSCFSAQDERGYAHFRRMLMREYLEKMLPEGLSAGLDFLGRARINDTFAAARTTIAHGRDDLVAPVEEARGMAQRLGARFVEIAGAGHVPFLGQRSLGEILRA